VPKAEVDLSGIPGSAPSGAVSASITVRNIGADGKLAISVRAGGQSLRSERLYLGRDSARTLPFEVRVTDDTPVHISVEYVETMLPADEWKTTIKLERPAEKAEPEKTAKNVRKEMIELTPGKYYVIAGEAGVEYAGRASDSYHGSVVVLIKPDSSVVVHADKGVYPRNYMGRAHIIQVNEGNGMRISAENNGERLSVTFKSIGMFQAPFDAGSPDVAAAPLKAATQVSEPVFPRRTGRWRRRSVTPGGRRPWR